MKFYVEVWQPEGQKAELFGSYATFKEAVDWLDSHMAEDAKRLPRLFGHVDGLEHKLLAHRRMHPG